MTEHEQLVSPLVALSELLTDLQKFHEKIAECLDKIVEATGVVEENDPSEFKVVPETFMAIRPVRCNRVRDLEERVYKGYRLYQRGPWYVLVSKKNRKCSATSGDYWFSLARSEAARLLRGRAG